MPSWLPIISSVLGRDLSAAATRSMTIRVFIPSMTKTPPDGVIALHARRSVAISGLDVVEVGIRGLRDMGIRRNDGKAHGALQCAAGYRFYS